MVDDLKNLKIVHNSIQLIICFYSTDRTKPCARRSFGSVGEDTSRAGNVRCRGTYEGMNCYFELYIFGCKVDFRMNKILTLVTLLFQSKRKKKSRSSSTLNDSKENFFDVFEGKFWY